MPVTTTGVGESLLLPLPSCPSLLCPQQRAVLSASSAQLCSKPAVTAMAVVIPATLRADPEGAFVPSPSWPKLLLPQHCTPPADVTWQLWFAPAASATG